MRAKTVFQTHKKEVTEESLLKDLVGVLDKRFLNLESPLPASVLNSSLYPEPFKVTITVERI